jgi:hypothetical protein
MQMFSTCSPIAEESNPATRTVTVFFVMRPLLKYTLKKYKAEMAAKDLSKLRKISEYPLK